MMNVHNLQVSKKVVIGIRFATDAQAATTALPVASLAMTSDTAADILPTGGGKVTPVRYEHGQ